MAMPSLHYLKRDYPDIDTHLLELPRRSRLPLVIFLATHGLWLATSFAGLMFAISDAYPQSGSIVVASRTLEP
ncbi:MAG: hypothetical protein WCC66_10855 [Rhizobiaceae bacterium]